jgi:hypothetical protein
LNGRYAPIFLCPAPVLRSGMIFSNFKREKDNDDIESQTIKNIFHACRAQRIENHYP